MREKQGIKGKWKMPQAALPASAAARGPWVVRWLSFVSFCLLVWGEGPSEDNTQTPVLRNLGKQTQALMT